MENMLYISGIPK